ncbi:MAG TPA: ribonuclease R [Candidatus Onthocola stercorigallinarum]|nr:ribonuclease R [Candidatus Onthocola stercorigallinarum]
MEEQIIEILKDETKGKTIDEINKELHYKSIKGINDLQTVLDQMTTEGILHKSKKREYILMSNTKTLKCGYIRINRSGNGFVDVENGPDIFVRSENLNGAINNDFVEVDYSTRNNEAYVIKILKRDLSNLVGEMVSIKNKLVFKPDDDKLNIIVKLTKDSLNQVVEGHKVLVQIIKEIGKRQYLGKIAKIIGHKNDPGVDIIAIALRHGIEVEFSEEVIKELEDIPNVVLENEKVGRKDLTNEMIFTIDGDDTKDIDDAISIKKNNENYILGVHIADVSHYVKMGSSLYDSAFNRGTSSYLADTVIPMIPHQLSNGICSLNPEVERLTISCVMTINKNGKVIDYDIFPSVIKSRKQMTYKNVNKILEEDIVPEGYEAYVSDLKLMAELAKILRAEKVSRGYIDFGLDEAKIIQDENGKAIDVVKRERGVGENLIEDFMIAANETIATHISNMDLPFIYRVHDVPNSEKIEDFKNLIKQMGYQIHTDLNKITPLTMQKVLNELRDKKEFNILSDMLLRSMKKAIYSTNNIGHFGLALTNYTHFTSPIRRFPDLTVHCLLRTYLFENRIDMETINYNEKYLVDVATNSSETEVAAQEAERDVLDMKMAEYMESHIGEEYDGIISSVTNFGMFVELDNLIEGLVHISTLDGYFEYIPELLSLVSDNKRYRIGDTVRVVVVSASKESSTIDFELVGDQNGDKK